MMNDKIRRNDEIPMTNPAKGQPNALRHSGFGFLSSFVIRHLSFLLLAGSFAVTAGTPASLTIAWTNNMLSVSGPDMPGGKVDIVYPKDAATGESVAPMPKR